MKHSLFLSAILITALLGAGIVHGQQPTDLIAEEMAQVYPELMIRDAAGKIQGVRYDELAPMLLNEVQKQQLKAALGALRANDQLVAQR